jgi:hypothetical protein
MTMTPSSFTIAYRRCADWTDHETERFAFPWVSYIDGAPWMVAANGHVMCGVPLVKLHPPGTRMSDDPDVAIPCDVPQFTNSDAYRNMARMLVGVPVAADMTQQWNEAVTTLRELQVPGMVPFVPDRRTWKTMVHIVGRCHEYSVVIGRGEAVPKRPGDWVALNPAYVTAIGPAERVEAVSPVANEVGTGIEASNQQVRVETLDAVFVVMPMRARRSA